GCTRIFDGSKTVNPPPPSMISPGAFAAPAPSSLGTQATTAPGMIQVKADLAAGQTHLNVKFFVPAPQQQAGGGLFGGGGAPFKPVVLAKFGAPITWTTSGALKSDATASVDAKGNGNKQLQTYTATLDIPAGATTAYVQI